MQQNSDTPTTVDISAAKQSKKILIVDDELCVCNLLLRIFSKDWQVDVAMGALEAVELLNTNIYNTVITDMEMPGKDGVWVLKRAMQRSPGTKRILHSGSAFSKIVHHIENGLVQHFVSKPENHKMLVKILKKRYPVSR